MSITVIFALAIASFVWMAAPGPGVIATAARSVAFGFRSTLPFILGIASGDLVYVLFAIFGLSMIAGMLGELFIFVRWTGAAYLIYLGIKAWRQPAVLPTQSGEAANLSKGSHARGYAGGLFLTLGNPKVIIFYLSFLPTFTDLKTLTFGEGVAIVTTVLTVLICVLVTYALAATQVRRLFRTERAVRYMNRCAGSLMIAAGCAVATRN
ncbi:LysE family translocator [Thalassospiraceae bacterium LMO-JJ14]|nr:LysE family translocator [Thalassospiraceae bacterium LMO-JJ14]